MALVVKRMQAEMIFPASVTPNHVLYLSERDLFDDYTMFIASVYKLDEQTNDIINPAEVLKEALSQVLVPYYPLAGRLKETDDCGRLEVTCNSKGVLFAEAKACCTLQDICYLKGSYTASKTSPLFLLGTKDPTQIPISQLPLLTMQVTAFECGGFVIGSVFSHVMMDREGFHQFMKALAETALRSQAASSRLSTVPVWERELLAPRSSLDNMRYLQEEHVPSELFFEGVASRKILSGHTFEFSDAFIEKLKNNVLEEGKGSLSYCSKFEVLVAFIWKNYVQAQLQVHCADLVPSFYYVINARRVMNGVLSRGFYGNCTMEMIVTADDIYSSQENKENIKNAEVVKAIRKSRERLTEEAFMKWINFRSVYGRPKKLLPKIYLSNYMIFDDLTRVEFAPDFNFAKGVRWTCAPFYNELKAPLAMLMPRERDVSSTPVLIAMAQECMTIFKARITELSHGEVYTSTE